MNTIQLSDKQLADLRHLLDYAEDHLKHLIDSEQESLMIGEWYELKKELPVIRNELVLPNPCRIRTTDELGNVSYIHKRPRGWCCTLANGTPAGMSYAVGYLKDETGFIFMLEDASSDEERLDIVKQAASGRVVELV